MFLWAVSAPGPSAKSPGCGESPGRTGVRSGKAALPSLDRSAPANSNRGLLSSHRRRRSGRSSVVRSSASSMVVSARSRCQSRARLARALTPGGSSTTPHRASSSRVRLAANAARTGRKSPRRKGQSCSASVCRCGSRFLAIQGAQVQVGRVGWGWREWKLMARVAHGNRKHGVLCALVGADDAACLPFHACPASDRHLPHLDSSQARSASVRRDPLMCRA